MREWAEAFLCTEAVEAPIYWLWARGLAGRTRAAYALLGSAWTHPLVWAWVSLGPAWLSYLGLVVVAEAFAVAAEGGWGRRLGVRHPWRAALLANGASVAAGLVTRAWFGWP